MVSIASLGSAAGMQAEGGFVILRIMHQFDLTSHFANAKQKVRRAPLKFGSRIIAVFVRGKRFRESGFAAEHFPDDGARIRLRSR